ncbi:bifunctional DNA primase/polymerase [Streptomyces maoxianensis]|uniref:Bifunctional DNA primase/polymerase n=1 Tax=Streptomyces maoxianensis TaxID=1459942 RepID=A0ABV9GCE8_9ACTN
MLRRSAHVNVGIATGPAGLLVVDLDLPKPGDSPGTLVGQTELTELGVRAGRGVPSTDTVCAPLAGGTCTSPFPPAHGRTDRTVGGGVGGTVGHASAVPGTCARCLVESASGVTVGGVDFHDPLPSHSRETPERQSGPVSLEGKPALTW